MPKPFGEYSRDDWLRLRPVLHRLKQARYDRITTRYLRRAALEGDAASIVRDLRGRRMMVTVAYEDPAAIEWQSRLIRQYVPGPIYIVADNSRDDDAARAVQAVAAREHRAYLRLPRNPWSGPAASRSHGLALNWLWRNLISPAEPESFGFLDDDLFPTAADDPFAPLSEQPIFGGIRSVGGRWFLWAGFCFFRFADVRHLPLDFGQDWFAGLDTGGRNWQPLYRHLDRASLRLLTKRSAPILPDVSEDQCSVIWCGSWLHEYGTECPADLGPRKREAVVRMLAPLLNDPTARA